MIASMIVGAAGSLLGNYLQRQAQASAMKRQQEQLDDARAREEASFTRRYYEDGLQRADTQNAMRIARENLLRSNRMWMGRNAVSGGTNAEAAAAKATSNEAMGNAMANVAASAEQRKDRIYEQHQTNVNNLDKTQMTLDAQNDQANVAAIGNAANQVGQLAQSAIAAEMANSSSGFSPRSVPAQIPFVAAGEGVKAARTGLAGKIMSYDVNDTDIANTVQSGKDKLSALEKGKWGSIWTPKI